MEDTCKGSVAGPEFKHQESGNVRRSPPPWVIDESWTPPIVDRENSHIAGKVIVTSSKGCSYYAKVGFLFFSIFNLISRGNFMVDDCLICFLLRFEFSLCAGT